MQWSLALISLFFIFSSTLVQAAACDTSDTATATGAAFNTNCTVTDGTTGTVIQLNFYNGFSDATAISAIDGNNGTTVGAQRKLSFIKAAELIAAQVDTPQTLLVDADFTALSCDASSATLGSAGASTNMGNVSPAAGILNTFYPIGLLNAIGNNDYSAGSDITAQFNANIGNAGCLQASSGWYYGFGTPTSGYIGFTTVLLHEITHGLGFASLTSASTGAKASGIDDIFSNFLYALANDADWSVSGGLNDSQRAASAISSTGLLWNGSNVNTQAVGLLTAGFEDTDSDSGGTFNAGDKVQMYAPNPVENGSSVSHFNTAASPNELMEPQYTEGQYTLGLAAYLLKDIGWTMDLGANAAPTITAVDQSTNEDTALTIDASSWGTDDDGDTLTYTVASSCATSITCSINTDGTNFVMTPAANHNGGTHSITVNVSDGNGGTNSDAFNLNVIAQNDVPSWNTISTQTVNYGTPVDINLSSYASDVDGDTLTYTATSCGTGLSCNITSSTLTLSASSNAGNTVNVTIQANDGNAGLISTSFSVNITNTNTAPVLSNIGDQHAPMNENVVITLSATDAEGNTLSYTKTSDANSVANISGTTLTLNSATVGSFSVTIEVTDDGSPNLSDNETFTFTTYAQPSIDVDGTALNPNDLRTISNIDTSIDVSSVSSAYSYALTFEGNNADDLLSLSNDNLVIEMPTSGQFAGEYVLIFTDSNTGSTYDFTFVRHPRFVFSATQLLANQSIQTLDIEGGAADTLYTLISSETALTFEQSNIAVTSINAEDDAASFNKASVVLAIGNVISSTDVTVSASSEFETVNSNGISLQPSRTHTVTIEDNTGTFLTAANFVLDTSLLEDYNLPHSYTPNSNGQVAVVLPENNTDYSAQVSLSGFTSADVTLDSSILSQTLVLEEIANPMVLSGDIIALNNLSFDSELPVVTLTLDDGTQTVITVAKESSTLATFHYTHDLNLGSITQLSVNHSDGIGLIFNINANNDLLFEIFMESSTQVITNEPTKVGSSGGSLGLLLLFILILFRKQTTLGNHKKRLSTLRTHH